MATNRTVFLNSNLTDVSSLAAKYDPEVFEVIMLDGGSAQIQAYLSAHGGGAASLSVVSASGASDGLFTPRVVFVDPSVADYQALVAGMPAGCTVVMLDAARDGIQQMRDFLAHNVGQVGAIDIVTDLASLDVVSHGAPGQIVLGSTVLNAATMAQYASQLAEIGSHMTSNGDILLYGCDVAAGEAGQVFIAGLAQATGADVAASTNLTGSAAAGGDWVLEASAGGTIEASAIAVASYDGTLVDDAATISGISVDSGTVGDFITNDTQLMFSGQFTPKNNNTNLYMWVDNVLSGTIVVAANKGTVTNWTYTHTPLLSEGTHSVAVSTTSNNLNGELNRVTVTIDTSADKDGNLRVTVPDALINASEKTAVAFNVTGIDADASATVTFSDGTNSVVVAGASGVANLSSLVDKVITVSVRATDLAGNTTAGAGTSLTLDTKVTKPTVGLAVDTTDGNGNHASDGRTSDPSLVFGAKDADASRTILLDGQNIGVNYPTGLAEGTHTVSVTDTDTAGNTATTDFEFNYDHSIAAPVIALVNDTGDGGSGHNSDARTRDGAFTVSQLASDASKRVITVDGATVSDPAQFNQAALQNGLHTIVVTDTDFANNTASSSFQFTIDRSIAAPTIALTNDTTDGGAGHNADRRTRDGSFTVSQLESDAAKRVITVDGTVVSDPAQFNQAGLADGLHTIVVTDTDYANNTITQSLDFTIDRSIAAPTISLTNDTTDGGAGHGSDARTRDGSFTVSQLESDAAKRVITVDGTVVADPAQFNQAGLTEGLHTVVVTDTDYANNSVTRNFDFTIDRSIKAPTISLTNDTSDGGTGHGSDARTRDGSFTVSQMESDVAKRVITVDGTVVADPAQFNQSGLSDGVHTIVVTDTDYANNTATTSLNFTIDRSIAAPTISLTNDTTDGAAGHNADARSRDGAFTVSQLESDAARRVITVDGTVVADPAQFNQAGLAEGIHTIVVTDTDYANNSITKSFDFTIDRSIAAPTISLANDTTDGGNGHDKDGVTRDGSFSISQLENDAAKRLITVDGTTVADLTQFNQAGLGDGVHTVVVTDTDYADNSVTRSFNFTIDRSIAAPTISLINDTTDGGAGHSADARTRDGSFTVSQLEGDAAKRVITVDGTVVADPAQFNQSALAEGLHTIVVTDTDYADNSITKSFGFTVDRSIATPTISLMSDTSDGGSGHDKDGVTRDGSFTVSQLESDAAKRVMTVDGVQVADPAQFNQSGLNDGLHTIVVTDTDYANNSTAKSLSFTIDRSIAAPTISLANDTTDGGAGHESDARSRDGSFSVSQLESDAAKRVITVDGTVVADPAQFNQAGLAEGLHTIVVTDTDHANNTVTKSLDFTIDRSIATPSISLISDTTDGGDGHDKDGVTRDGSFAISQLESDAGKRVVTVDGTVVADLAQFNQGSLADGHHTVVVTDTDHANNSATKSFVFTIDRSIAAPTISLANDTTDGGAGHNADARTRDGSFTVSQLESDAAQRVVTVDGTVVADPAQFNQSGLAEGLHTIVVTDTDYANNSITKSFDFTIDRSIAAPTISLANDTSDGGQGHDKDGVTRDGSFNISQLESDAAKRVITVDGAVVADPALFNQAGLKDGLHTIVVTDTDHANNTATSTFEFTIDRSIAAPTISLTNDTTDGGGGHDSDSRTRDGSFTISQLESDAARRVITVDGTVVADPAQFNQAGLKDGLHTIVVTDTDYADNTVTKSFGFTIDRSIAAPTISLTNDTSDGGASHDNDGVTRDGSFTVSQLENDAAKRVITVDGAVVADPAQFNQAGLKDGLHTIVVTDTDYADNTVTRSFDFTIDRAITAPTISLSNDTTDGGDSYDKDGVTRDGSFTVSQLESDAVKRVVTVDGAVVADPAQFNQSALKDGLHTIVVTDTDYANNTVTKSLDFTVDRSIKAPTISLTNDTTDGGAGHSSDALSRDGSFTVSQLESDAGMRVITVDGTEVADPAQFNQAGLNEGAHTIVVTDTDHANNTVSKTFDFTIDRSIATPTISLTHDTTDGGEGHDKDGVTRDGSFAVSQLESDAAKRVITVDGTVVADPAQFNQAALQDGLHTVVVTDTDFANNTVSNSFHFTIDRSIAAPTIALSNDTTDGGAGHNADVRTRDGTFTVSQLQDDAAKRTITVDGAVVADPAQFNQAGLKEGLHTIVVTDTDYADNSVTRSFDFTIDRSIMMPTISLVNDTTDGGDGNDKDGVTRDGSFTVSQLESDAAKRVITVDGTVVADPAQFNQAGLKDGVHTVVVTDTDYANNIVTKSFDFTIDRSIAAPTISLTNDTTDGGNGHDKDGVTRDGSFTVSQPESDAAQRVITVDGTVVADPAQFNQAGLKNGVHTIVVTDTDHANNTITKSLNFTIDRTIASPIIALANDTTDGGDNHNKDGITRDGSFTVSQLENDAASRVITVDGTVVADPVQFNQAGLQDGVHTVVVTDTDYANNSVTNSFEFTIDRSIAAPTISLTNDTTNGGEGHDKDGVTRDGAFSVSQLEGDAAKRVVKVDGTLVADLAQFDQAGLKDGLHTIAVTDTDYASNTVTKSFDFTIDRTAPAEAAIKLANDTADANPAHAIDKLTSDAALEFGALEQGAIRVFSINGAAAQTTYVAPSVDGDYSVAVTDTDAAGNSTTTAFSFKLDKHADVGGDLQVTVPDPLINKAERGAVAYAVQGLDNDASAKVSFSDGSKTVIGSNGLVDLTGLADGNIAVSILATDFAGNTANGSGTSLVLDSTAPVFVSAATASVAENAGANFAVYAAQANDVHGAKYSLLANNADDASAFTIDANGIVHMNASADFETRSSYKFTVVATDSAGNASQKAVSLAVADVNEAPDAAPIALNTIENASILIPVLPEYAFDADAGDALTVARVTSVTLAWAPDTTSTSITNPVTKQQLTLGQVYATATISSDGKGITITPSAEFDWATTGQKVLATLNYTVKDKGGLEGDGMITLAIWGSTSDKGKNWTGTNGADTMSGEALHENILQGANGNDTLTGGNVTDALYGGTGDDHLMGGKGIDYLYGDSGNDWLEGGTERDILFGGKGNDILSGGEGADYFVFEPQLGLDRITDFNLNEDKLFFLDFFADPISAHDFVAKYAKTIGPDTLITLPGGSVTLVGVSNLGWLESAIAFSLNS